MSRSNPLSLQNRVAIIGLLVLTAWVVILTIAVNAFVGAQLRSQADDVVRARAQAAATTLQVDPQGAVTIRDNGNDSAIDVGTWIFEGDRIIESPQRASSLEGEAADLAGQGPLTQESAGILWYAQPIISSGVQRATVVTSLPLASYQSTRQSIMAGTAGLALLLLVAVWFTLRAGVGRALSPVAEMTHQSARWSADDVDRRFGPGPRPAELEDLARTLDSVLDRLSAVLRHEQRLSAEISHELRTPVARIIAEVELLQQRDSNDAAITTALGTIAESAREMSQVLAVLMATSMSSNTVSAGRCDATEVLNRVVLTHRVDGIAMRVEPCEPVFASVDAALLERAMSPIMENAVRFAATSIDVTLESKHGVVRIDVRDDGVGIQPEHLDQVFEPGWSRSAAPGRGAGLGLALARRLLVSAGGSLQALPSDHGARLVASVPPG